MATFESIINDVKNAFSGASAVVNAAESSVSAVVNAAGGASVLSRIEGDASAAVNAVGGSSIFNTIGGYANAAISYAEKNPVPLLHAAEGLIQTASKLVPCIKIFASSLSHNPFVRNSLVISSGLK